MQDSAAVARLIQLLGHQVAMPLRVDKHDCTTLVHCFELLHSANINTD
jgi:hypothetical protein